MSWDPPDIAVQRASEREARRWWAEHHPPERGGVRPRRCGRWWAGECPRGQHNCARPWCHPGICMCYCGDRAPDLVPQAPGEAVAGAEQEVLW